MSFELEDFNSQLFHRIHLVAESMLTKRQKSPHLAVVTHDSSHLSKPHQKEMERIVEDSWLLGYAVIESTGSGDVSKIWIAPELSFDSIYATLVHEVAHVYVGMYRGHNHIWRAFNIRLMAHLNELFGLPATRYTYPFGASCISRYSRGRDSDSREAELDKILCYAEAEHAKVVKNIERYLA